MSWVNSSCGEEVKGTNKSLLTLAVGSPGKEIRGDVRFSVFSAVSVPGAALHWGDQVL